MKILGKISCWASGHKRGKRVGAEGTPSGVVAVYACPRCGAKHTRKIKVKS